ncbi:carbonic anhydrase [Amylostereum chailletii]|nr:carbonic anhydrase [Amylostereum chailletii]
MTVAETFAEANKTYVANFGDKGALPLPPGKKLTVVTCMDARIDPAAHLGIKEGDAHVIRNAGGVAAEAVRSIVISQRLLGTREIALFHHTDCGMLTFTTDHLRNAVKADAPGDETVARTVDGIHFHEFGDLEGAVKSDVEFLKNHPLVLKETAITGWIYEVETGKVKQVA